MSDSPQDVTPQDPPSSKVAHKKPKTAFFVNILSSLLIGVAATSMAFALILSAMGMKTMYVVSNSMVPTFEKGDLLVVTSDYNSLAAGDIIAYNAAWADGKHVTHRVVSINGDTIMVKGDNNKTNDPPLSKHDVYGEVVASVPNAGMLLNPVTIVVMTVVGLILSYLADWLRPLARHAKPAESFLKRRRDKNTEADK